MGLCPNAGTQRPLLGTPRRPALVRQRVPLHSDCGTVRNEAGEPSNDGRIFKTEPPAVTYRGVPTFLGRSLVPRFGLRLNRPALRFPKLAHLAIGGARRRGAALPSVARG